MIDTPDALQKQLIAMFPNFKEELIEEVFDYGYDFPLSFHRVWMALARVIYTYLQSSTLKALKEFCYIVNHMVDAGGDKENAVSTCLLEHATQLGIKKIIKPYLSSEAKYQLR